MASTSTKPRHAHPQQTVSAATCACAHRVRLKRLLQPQQPTESVPRFNSVLRVSVSRRALPQRLPIVSAQHAPRAHPRLSSRRERARSSLTALARPCDNATWAVSFSRGHPLRQQIDCVRVSPCATRRLSLSWSRPPLPPIVSALLSRHALPAFSTSRPTQRPRQTERVLRALSAAVARTQGQHALPLPTRSARRARRRVWLIPWTSS